MHLTPEELIDLAEDERAALAAPHLQACEVCRRQVVNLRATMSAAADFGVPEPSPLFWDHLSRRVRESVDAEESFLAPFPGSSGWKWPLGSWRGWAIAGVAAAVMISIYVTTPGAWPPPSSAGDRAAVSPAPPEPFGVDDPSLALFADLAEQMDPEAITEIGWSSRVGAVDEVVAGLSDDERLELQRLLEEELAKS